MVTKLGSGVNSPRKGRISCGLKLKSGRWNEGWKTKDKSAEADMRRCRGGGGDPAVSFGPGGTEGKEFNRTRDHSALASITEKLHIPKSMP
jgi:hypothetical protein